MNAMKMWKSNVVSDLMELCRRVASLEATRDATCRTTACQVCGKVDFTANMEEMSYCDYIAAAAIGFPGYTSSYMRNVFVHLDCVGLERCECHNGLRKKKPVNPEPVTGSVPTVAGARKKVKK